MKILLASLAAGLIALVVLEDVLARRTLRRFFADRARLRALL